MKVEGGARGTASRKGVDGEKNLGPLRAWLNSPWLTLFLFAVALILLSRRRDVRFAIARASKQLQRFSTTAPDPQLASPSLSSPTPVTQPTNTGGQEGHIATPLAKPTSPGGQEEKMTAKAKVEAADAWPAVTEAAAAQLTDVTRSAATAQPAAVTRPAATAQSAAVTRSAHQSAAVTRSAHQSVTEATAETLYEEPKPKRRPRASMYEGLPSDCVPLAARPRHLQYCRTSVASKAECGPCPAHARCNKQRWCCDRYMCTCVGRNKVPQFEGNQLVRCSAD